MTANALGHEEAHASGKRRIPEVHLDPLDGYRALAIVAVLLYHVCLLVPSKFGLFSRWGWSGVDLFFVLSGYLITTILVRNRHSPRYFSAFYGRRVLRIFPVYYVALVLGLFILPALARHFHLLAYMGFHWVSLRNQALFWANLSNLRSAFYPMAVPSLSHFWTLAIEEQFYLIWPIVLRRLGRRTCILICIAGLISGPVLRSLPFVLRLNQTFPDFSYRFTLTHSDGMFAGSLLALLLPLISRDRAKRVLLCCLVLGGATLGFLNHHPALNTSWAFSALACFFTGAVGLMVLYPRSILGKALGSIPLKRLGQRSYAFYVAHPILILFNIVLLQRVWPRFFDLGSRRQVALLALASLLTSWCVAEASWVLIEERALRYKDRFPY